MESVFPDLLFLDFFAPFVLRLGAAFVFVLLASNLYRHRSEIAITSFPLVGTPGMTITWGKIIATAAIALFLAIGLYTQAVAILGFVAAVKAGYFAKRYPAILPHGRTAYFLLALICFTLIATGAGGFAFDLPY